MALHDESATTRCEITSWNAIEDHYHNFGIFDEKGRSVGVRSLIIEATFALSPQNYGYQREPGLYFVVHVQSTRDQMSYGSSQEYHVFRTFEHAAADVRCRVYATRKRYAKKYKA